MIDFGMNVQEAGDAARIRHTGSSQPTDETMKDGGKLYLETSIGCFVGIDIVHYRENYVDTWYDVIDS